jgi:hypothetical protein
MVRTEARINSAASITFVDRYSVLDFVSSAQFISIVESHWWGLMNVRLLAEPLQSNVWGQIFD